MLADEVSCRAGGIKSSRRRRRRSPRVARATNRFPRWSGTHRPIKQTKNNAASPAATPRAAKIVIVRHGHSGRIDGKARTMPRPARRRSPLLQSADFDECDAGRGVDGTDDRSVGGGRQVYDNRRFSAFDGGMVVASISCLALRERIPRRSGRRSSIKVVGFGQRDAAGSVHAAHDAGVVRGGQRQEDG